MQFRNDIQGLRAIAFLLVYVFHLNPNWLPGGFIGVDMFFVISGYLITNIILHQKEKNTFGFVSFYEKRIKRIAPAYYVALLFIALAGSYFYLQSDSIRLRSGLYRALAFVSNQFFATGESYFGGKLSENPLLHTWSLAIEMQFYLILPFILIFIRNRWLPLVITTVLVILTGYSTYKLFYTENFSAVYFSLLSRIPEFLVGVLLSILFLKKAPLSKNRSLSISMIGILILAATGYYLNESTPFPGVFALIPCIATGLLLVSGDNIIKTVLSSKPLVYIGELSYSLYLWHWPIMAYLRYNDPSRTEFTITEIILISVLTFVFSWLSYTYIEKGFRNQNNKKFALSFVPVILVLCVLTVKLPTINFNGTIPQEYTKTLFGKDSHDHPNIETFGNLKSDNNAIALIGDSHAHVLKAFMDYMGKRHNFSFKTITASAFPAIDGILENEMTPRNLPAYKNSRKLINLTQTLINQSNIIFINSLGFHRVPSLKTALENLAKKLRPDQKLIIFVTVPTYYKNPLRANKSIVKDSGEIFKRASYKANEDTIREIAKKYPNIYIYDISKSEIFADGGVFYKDTIMYYDHSHLNQYGSLALARNEEENFIKFFREIYQK